jgi:hypothetical protein
MLANKGYAPKLENNKAIYNQRFRSTRDIDGIDSHKASGTLNNDLKVIQDILFTKAIPNVEIAN